MRNSTCEDSSAACPTTTVHVAIGASAWPDAPADRRVDLSTPHLDASMFAAPAAATGDWFVALGSRADCLVAGSTTDGTPEQAARLARVLDALAAVSSDIALVAVAGAGHAARLAAQAQAAVTDLVTLGTPLVADRADRPLHAAHRRRAAAAASPAARRADRPATARRMRTSRSAARWSAR